MTGDELSDSERSNRTLTVYVYGLQLLGLLLVFPPVLGFAINCFRRDRVKGTIYASHFSWQVRTFWWMLGWGLLGGGLIFAAEHLSRPLAGVAGATVLLAAIVWFTYRLLRGYIRLIHGQPMPRRWLPPSGD